MYKFLAVALLFVFMGCSWNVPDIKAHAESRLAEFGYKVIAYEGYKWSFPDGCQVWYQIHKVDDPQKIRYSCFLTKWQGEYHLYGPTLVETSTISAAANINVLPVLSPNTTHGKTE